MEDAENFAYVVAKDIVTSRYPVYLGHFDELWEHSLGAYRRGRKPRFPEVRVRSGFFDSTAQQLMENIIPFILAVVGSLLAQWIWEKKGFWKEKVREIALQELRNFRIAKELGDEIVESIVKALENRIKRKDS